MKHKVFANAIKNISSIRQTKLILMIVLFCSAGAGFGQLTFSVAPGFSMNSASFGFKMGRLVPFAGVQYYRAGGTYSYEYDDFNYTTGAFETEEHEYAYKAGLIMPNLGLKYFIREAGSLKAHLTLNVSKPMVFGKAEYDGEEDEDLEDYVKGLSLWGGEFSFGTEYFFDEHFSLGGEFGLRWLRASFHEEFDQLDFDPITGAAHNSTSTYDMRFNASPTFSKIALNFYF